MILDAEKAINGHYVLIRLLDRAVHENGFRSPGFLPTSSIHPETRSQPLFGLQSMVCFTYMRSAW
jgi:hypothetical protein